LRLLRWMVPIALAVLALLGCAALDEKQREWIFQPSDRSWGASAEIASGMQELWIEFRPRGNGDAGAQEAPGLANSTVRSVPTAGSPSDPQSARLHALWAAGPTDQAPVLLYLHGARFNVAGSAMRIQRMQELGFAVLAIDYRGFGKSTAGLPSEQSAYEDARVAWDWLRSNKGKQARFIFGHSLGAAIAIELASQVNDERGTIVEGAFTSIPDVVSHYKWGWLPVGPLITQRFEAWRRVPNIGSPLLVVHGTNDGTIHPELGRKLYEAAQQPKRLVLVDGASHHNTMWMGQNLYRQALREMFGI
jgi:pimeloyl-ACP methyl ester carboxylesterase